MGRMHSADIARRANKTASWIDDKLRWIKKYKPELWAELDAQEAARKSQLETTSSNSQTAWTLSAAGTDVFLDYLGLPRQKPEPLADIMLSRRMNVDDLIEVLAAKIDANPIEWRNYAADLLGCDRGADPIIITQQQAIQLLSHIWDTLCTSNSR